ncbi:putative enzyme related to lactoylglutathione lyase [Nocardiopsis sp. Huas11]|uniref:VOC family protein n=1 Tax=Nocardiopsis sp. Huas11 TaxID=2183912 RepID=UPI000EB4D2D7|nr:VOC family protein [Nocardiopsis sp. Huas11]RKS05077.1 putative enzyme related to lactoylglutathione lyase [Nocardiopsis sp. Huas11]
MRVKFAELPVFDQDRAIAFYTRALGCTVAADAPMGEDGWRWVELAFPGAESHLHFLARENEEPSADPVLVLVDDDVQGTVEKLREQNVEIVSEPQQAPWEPGTTFAEFRDSEGNRMVVTDR